MAINDGGIGIIDRQELEAELGGELLALGALEIEGGAGGIGLASELFEICIAAEMRIFFDKKEIVLVEEVSCGKAAKPSADDDDVEPSGNGGTRELKAVANLVADIEVLAIDECARLVLRSEKRESQGAASGHRASDDELENVPAGWLHRVASLS